MFIIAGFVQNAIICLAIGIVATIAVLFAIKKFGKNVYAAKASK